MTFAATTARSSGSVTPGGFRCKRVAGIAISGEWRCAHPDGRAYRFTFGD